MSLPIPEILVGQPVGYETLSVFPLFAVVESPLHYLLSDEAISTGQTAVHEVSEGGSVPELVVENRGELCVLFLEGEELVGARQNRVLNTSVLIAAKSRTQIPVSCVERGRWAYKSRDFDSIGTYSPSRLRHVLKATVTASLRAAGSHRSSQSAVWGEVDRQQESLDVASGTSAMTDTFAAYSDRLSEFLAKVQYVQGASGMAVALGKRIVALDLFDKPATCQKVWNRLLSAFALDALETEATKARRAPRHVRRLIKKARKVFWEKVQPVGEGEEYRAEWHKGLHASALTFQGTVVHASLVAAQ